MELASSSVIGSGSLNFFDCSGAPSGPPIHAADAPVLRPRVQPRWNAADGGARCRRRPCDRVGRSDRPGSSTSPLAWSPMPCSRGHNGTITAVAFSPDGREVATGGNDDQVILHDAVSGRPTGQPIAFDSPVTRMAFDPIRPRLAVATLAPGVQVFDTRLAGTGGQGAGQQPERLAGLRRHRPPARRRWRRAGDDLRRRDLRTDRSSARRADREQRGPPS